MKFYVTNPTCNTCGAPSDMSQKHRRDMLRSTGRSYCSPECAKAYHAKISSATMAATNRRYASARMKTNNPMRHDEIRERMRGTLLRIGHKPVTQGGNGRPATKAEQRLLDLFVHEGFSLQCIVPVGLGMGNGWPTHYKIDCGSWDLKIAIEADGPSHSTPSRRDQDRRKDAFLTGKGWIVFRFTNQMILEQTETVRSTVMSTISKLKICIPIRRTA